MTQETTLAITEVPLSEIDANEEMNCRGTITAVDVHELLQHIKKNGLLVPGIVIPHSDPKSGYKYRLIAGFRRYKAISHLGWEKYPVTIRKDIKEDDALFFNLDENIQRKDLTIMQEARAIQRIRDRYKYASRDYCAIRLGKSPGWVQIREALLNLPEPIQKEAEIGTIKQTQIRELNSILKREGEKRCFEAAREMKRAKHKGVKPRIKKKINRNAARQRARQEIFDMQADINDSIPYELPNGLPPLWARCLAWAAGEITDNELFDTCQKYAEYVGVIWIQPTDESRGI